MDGNKLQQSEQGPEGKSEKDRANTEQKIKIKKAQEREFFRLISCAYGIAWILNQRGKKKSTNPWFLEVCLITELSIVIISNISPSFQALWPYRVLLLPPSHFSRVWLCAAPQTAAHQAPLSLGFSRLEYWSGLPFPSPMHAFMLSRFSCPTLCDPMNSSPPRLLHPQDSLGKNTGVGCHFLLQPVCYVLRKEMKEWLPW